MCRGVEEALARAAVWVAEHNAAGPGSNGSSAGKLATVSRAPQPQLPKPVSA